MHTALQTVSTAPAQAQSERRGGITSLTAARTIRLLSELLSLMEPQLLSAMTTGRIICNIGMEIYPGPGQQLIGIKGTGVLADSSLSAGVLIDSRGGVVRYLWFHGWWVGSTKTTDHPIIIRNTSGIGNRVHLINFSGGVAHQSQFGINPVVDIENDANNIVISGNTIVPDSASNSPTQGSAILMNSSGPSYGGTGMQITITGNNFFSEYGAFSPVINITGSGDQFTITGNLFGDQSPAVSWPSKGALARAVIADNMMTGNGNSWEFQGGVTVSCNGLGSWDLCAFSRIELSVRFGYSLRRAGQVSARAVRPFSP